MTPTPRAPHREAPSRGVLHLRRQQVAPMPREATGVVRPRHVASSRAPGVRRWLESRRPAWTRPGGALDASVLPPSTALARTVTCPQRGHSTRRPSGSPRLSCRRAGPGNRPPSAGGLRQCSQKWLSRSSRVRPLRPLLSLWPGRSRSPAQPCTLPSEPGAVTHTPRMPLQGTLTLLTARRGCFGLSLRAVGTSHPRGRLELPRKVGPGVHPVLSPADTGTWDLAFSCAVSELIPMLCVLFLGIPVVEGRDLCSSWFAPHEPSLRLFAHLRGGLLGRYLPLLRRLRYHATPPALLWATGHSSSHSEVCAPLQGCGCLSARASPQLSALRSPEPRRAAGNLCGGCRAPVGLGVQPRGAGDRTESSGSEVKGRAGLHRPQSHEGLSGGRSGLLVLGGRPQADVTRP